jgi:hypothetical protein
MKDIIDTISSIFNRSVHQTNQLLEILDNDYNKLIEVEWRIKNLFIFYCPMGKEECDEILNQELPDNIWFEKPEIIVIN